MVKDAGAAQDNNAARDYRVLHCVQRVLKSLLHYGYKSRDFARESAQVCPETIRPPWAT